ncbi:MAG TPA: hypothetical protein VFF52_05680 [Isosphaeraceae bacterium]|nr:hypothetical protein [Isosphaeraceae bacterium]
MTRQTYTARCRRSGRRWAIEVPEVSGVWGVFGQAHRLDQVERMVRDAIATMLEIPPDAFDVVVEVGLPEHLEAEVARVRELRREAEIRQKHASEAIRQAASDLVGAGLTVRDAGRVLGVSYQRAAQMRRGRAPRPAAG